MQHDDRATREELLRRSALAGDELAWRTLYDESFGSLYRYVHWRSAGQRDRTEEVVQESWLTAVRRMADFDPKRGAFLQWLRGIAANVLRNHLRQENLRIGRTEILDRHPLTDGPLPDQRLEERERAVQLMAALAILPPRYEQVLRAKYVDGLTIAQIAQTDCKTLKAVESLLSRARQAFRQAYENQTRSGGAELPPGDNSNPITKPEEISA